MKTFPELLKGATPGPWFAYRNSHYYEINIEDRDCAKSVAELCPSKCAWGDSVEKINAEYLARLNPATMAKVWEALQGAKRELGTRDADDPIEVAIAALNGGPQLPPKPAPSTYGETIYEYTPNHQRHQHSVSMLAVAQPN